jgi:transposase InsO family protein
MYEMSGSGRAEALDKRKLRDWFKVRKYVVNRIRGGETQARAAYMAGVSAGFVSKWWNRWKRAKCWEALRTRSTRPHNIRRKKWQFVESIVSLRTDFPFIGAQKIKAMLDIELSHQKVHEVLVEEGLVDQGPKKRRVWRAFSRKHSNSLWQCDVMEIDDTKTRFLVTFIDDHSRCVLASRVLNSATSEAVSELLRSTVRMFGRPRQVLTDHGAQFTHSKSGGATRFGTTCEALGIKHIMAGVRRPTTCGKIERWHRSLREELIARLDDVSSFETELPAYLEWYNCSRPHFALDMRAPLDVYLADFMSVDDITEAARVHEVGG